MTVLVGVRGKGGVLLAADSAATVVGWGEQRERQNGKVHLLNEKIAFGCCGSPRVSQLVRFMAVPELSLGADEYEWAVKSFVPALRSTLDNGGSLVNDSGVMSMNHSSLILAIRHRLFVVRSDFQVGEEDFPWTADGSGADIAAGHLRGLLGEGTAPLDDNRLLGIARAAVESASDLNAYCRGNVSHVRTKRYTAAEKKLAKEVLAAA